MTDVRLRKLYKIIALVAFNADNERSALSAIRLKYSENYDVMLNDDLLRIGLEDDGDGIVEILTVLKEDGEKPILKRTGCLGLIAIVTLPASLIYFGL